MVPSFSIVLTASLTSRITVTMEACRGNKGGQKLWIQSFTKAHYNPWSPLTPIVSYGFLLLRSQLLLLGHVYTTMIWSCPLHKDIAQENSASDLPSVTQVAVVHLPGLYVVLCHCHSDIPVTERWGWPHLLIVLLIRVFTQRSRGGAVKHFHSGTRVVNAVNPSLQYSECISMKGRIWMKIPGFTAIS